MLTLAGLSVRDGHDTSPQGCQPISLSSSVCVGDLIAIIACSIAGIGFFFWAVHAVRKMRNDPFKDLYPEEPNHGPDNSALDHSVLAQHGVARSPSYPDRVRTRLTLSQPEEGFYRFTIPTLVETCADHIHIPALRRPSPAGGKSSTSRSQWSSRRGSLVRGRVYDERYGYEMRSVHVRNHARGPLLCSPEKL